MASTPTTSGTAGQKGLSYRFVFRVSLLHGTGGDNRPGCFHTL
jgi:hypothetical protein